MSPVKRQGGCICAAVRYEIHGEPLFVHACHCTTCQRVTGSAFQISMLMQHTQLTVLSGQLGSWTLTADSGNRRTLHFCTACGSQIWGDAPARGTGVVLVQAGTLDDTTWFTPQAHIWTRSRQPWVVIPSELPQFETSYAVADVWPERSLRRVSGPSC